MKSGISYPHLAARLFGVPLAIEPQRLDRIIRGVGPRLLSGDWEEGEARALRGERKPYRLDADGIATVPIEGPLLQRGNFDAESSYTTGYDDIARMLGQAIADTAVRAVLLDVDSPGGEVGGVRELASRIFASRGRKPLWAVANEHAYSAAYWLASAADQVWLAETGGVGSIGIMAIHLDQSKFDAALGLKYTAIFSGARKNDLTPHAPLNGEGRELLEAEVGRIHALFAGDVARHRPRLTVQAVLDTEAGVAPGPQAVAAGLADRIGSLSEARAALLASLADARSRPGGITASRAGTNTRSSQMHESSAPAPETGAGEAAPPPVAAQVIDLDASRRDAEQRDQAAMAAAAEIGELCLLAGRPEQAASFLAAIKPGTTPDQAVAQVRKALVDARAAAADASAVRSQRGAAVAGEGSAANNYGWDALIKRASAHRFPQSA